MDIKTDNDNKLMLKQDISVDVDTEVNENVDKKNFGKIIYHLSNITIYERKYSSNEIEDALKELQKIDVLHKSTSIDDKLFLHPLIIKICNNLYV